jgi:hypothetical protein
VDRGVVAPLLPQSEEARASASVVRTVRTGPAYTATDVSYLLGRRCHQTDTDDADSCLARLTPSGWSEIVAIRTYPKEGNPCNRLRGTAARFAVQ